MNNFLFQELIKCIKKILFIWKKAKEGWIIEYKGANKFLFLKKLHI
jgi:hypothetical protein